MPPEDGPQPAQPTLRPTAGEAEAALREVLVFLRTRTGRDFSYYKRATILRRIGRRLQVNDIDDLPGYLAFLRTHPGETGALLQDMLISVTNFFRDREAFDALELQIPWLFKDKRATDTVRVWVPGCATGEEAYSIAMLLSEHARKLDAPPQIEVFATDLDDGVIKSARDGSYPDTIAADVSEDRLRRWFLKEARGYRVRREIRELVLFALHDVLKDSPFSRLDLISCRNLLIYLTNEAQSRAFDIFHFALRPAGRLFLGTSESIENDGVLFSVLDKKYRIYAQRPTVRTTLPVPVGVSALSRALELQEKIIDRPALPKAKRRQWRCAIANEAAAAPHWIPAPSFGELHYKLIERFAPPSILVNAQYDIVHMSDERRAISCSSPAASPHETCCKSVHPMLRLDLHAALFSAAQSQTQADAFQVPIGLDGDRRVVDIHVFPAADLAPEHLLIKFDSRPLTAGLKLPIARVPSESDSSFSSA